MQGRVAGSGVLQGQALTERVYREDTGMWAIERGNSQHRGSETGHASVTWESGKGQQLEPVTAEERRNCAAGRAEAPGTWALPWGPGGDHWGLWVGTTAVWDFLHCKAP